MARGWLLALCAALLLSGCELVADFDRSKITHDAGARDAAAGDGDGDGDGAVLDASPGDGDDDAGDDDAG